MAVKVAVAARPRDPAGPGGKDLGKIARDHVGARRGRHRGAKKPQEGRRVRGWDRESNERCQETFTSESERACFAPRSAKRRRPRHDTDDWRISKREGFFRRWTCRPFCGRAATPR